MAAQGHITRLSVDLAQASRPGYEMEVLYPDNGVLSRQDDRYHTVPYSVAFMRCLDASQPLDPRLAGSPFRPYNAWTRFDHAQRRTQSFIVGGDSGVQECCFVPRSARAPEGDGYLIGVVDREVERRSDLVIVDAQRLGRRATGHGAPALQDLSAGSWLVGTGRAASLNRYEIGWPSLRRSQPFAMR